MGFKIKSFSTIRISVANIVESKNWYRRFFNQEPIEDLKDFVSFNIEGTIFDISLADSKSPVSTGGSVGYWLVDDLDAAISLAVELRGSVYRGPLKVEETQRTIVQIKDPQGNVFGIEADFTYSMPAISIGPKT